MTQTAELTVSAVDRHHRGPLRNRALRSPLFAYVGGSHSSAPIQALFKAASWLPEPKIPSKLGGEAGRGHVTEGEAGAMPRLFYLSVKRSFSSMRTEPRESRVQNH